MALYNPKIRDEIIRKLYFYARKKGVPMTYAVNEILGQFLANEPEPPTYEGRKKEKTRKKIF